MIDYRESADDLVEEDLLGFFEGWPDPPSPATHLRVLRGSDFVVLALEPSPDDRSRPTVVGFITAVSDGVLAAYLPLLEVRKPYRGRGIGSALVERMLARLEGLYMVDLVCDERLLPFYARLGMRSGHAALARRYEHQSGRPA